MNKKWLTLAVSLFLALFAFGCSDSSSNSSSADDDTTDICTEDPNAPGCVPTEEPEPDTEIEEI